MIYRILALGAVLIWAVCWVLRENPVELDKKQLIAVFFLFVVVGVTFYGVVINVHLVVSLTA